MDFLTPEIIKLFGRTKSKTIEDKNDVNMLHLEITEVVLVHCDIFNKDYQQESWIHLFFKNDLINY